MKAPLLLLAVLIAAWEAVVRGGLVNRLLLPAPSEIARSLWEDRSILAPDLAVTTWEVVLGLAAALVLGAGDSRRSLRKGAVCWLRGGPGEGGARIHASRSPDDV